MEQELRRRGQTLGSLPWSLLDSSSIWELTSRWSTRWGASAWYLASTQTCLGDMGLRRLRVDMCAYGLTNHLGTVYKPTGIVTNCPALQHSLPKRCSSNDPHKQLLGGRANPAAAYTQTLCDAVLSGLELQLRSDMENTLGFCGNVEDQDGLVKTVLTEGALLDDLSGEILGPKLTVAARKEEIDEMHQRRVYDPMSETEARRMGGGGGGLPTVFPHVGWVQVGETRDSAHSQRTCGERNRPKSA